MLFPRLAVNDYVVQVGQHVSFAGAENSVCELLEGGDGPMKTEGHHTEVEENFQSCKHCFLSILVMQGHLPIPPC